MVSEFKNEPYTDFSTPENQRKMQVALKSISNQLGEEYDLVIGSQRVKTVEKFSSYNPSERGQVVGVFQKGTPKEAEAAVQKAYQTFETWRRVQPTERAGYLFRAAEVMRRRRLELDAWMILEEGKNWLEADADVAEAIDFLEFYGREMLRLAGDQPLTRIPTEKSELVYIPLGVGVVIPPWNFPLAILVGMTSAAFVAGNTVVLKPSSDSPTMGAKFMEILEEIGLPPGVVNFLTGSGASVGDTLVGHAKTRFISFTGSKEVGLGIVELAAKTAPGQIWIKRVVAEMGGKDAIIVDHETDLEKAAQGVIASAFGFQGQKCSACSRAIVVAQVYDQLLDLLREKAQAITVGPVIHQENYMGPVINQRAMESILDYIEIGKKEGRLVCGGGPAVGNGFFIQPTIIADVDSRARISQEEIFGPVLAVIKVRDFDHALEIANDSEYGLTGAVYSDNRDKIEKAKRVFHCGNLYINRKCTGALVGVHPFGGFNMSGTDSKAGGRDYLLLYTQAKSISEFVG
ncbi:MAG: 1-pyrroline-5-carboxylate dehydrogenase [candidate division Zixibacteria bacterium SM23_81]|nr:MAG: 1-pyrroline-5-carboxylate dehydrogenase [candidate division Zixibacteria bacterium SM23_81]